jgi:hypothetical protein
MKKEFTDHSAALRLDLLGFNEPCFGYYLCKRSDLPVELEITTWVDLLPYDSSSCKAPTYQQAFRFFREKYKLEGIVQGHEDSAVYKFTIWTYLENGKQLRYAGYEYPSYEEAEKSCLISLIQIAEMLKRER